MEPGFSNMVDGGREGQQKDGVMGEGGVVQLGAHGAASNRVGDGEERLWLC